MAEIETSPKIANRDGMRCYLAGILFPIIYLTTEPYKSNRFVRFHAFQSIEFTTAWAALTIASNSIRNMGSFSSNLLSSSWLLFFVMWFVSMFKANHGRMFKLPILGSLAARWA